MAMKIVLGLVIILSVGAQGSPWYSRIFGSSFTSGTPTTPTTPTTPSTPVAPGTPSAPPTPATPAAPATPATPATPQTGGRRTSYRRNRRPAYRRRRLSRKQVPQVKTHTPPVQTYKSPVKPHDPPVLTYTVPETTYDSHVPTHNPPKNTYNPPKKPYDPIVLKYTAPETTYGSHIPKYNPPKTTYDSYVPIYTSHDKKNDPHDKKNDPHDKKNNPHDNTYPSHDEKHEPYLLPFTTPHDKKNDPHDKKDNTHDKKNNPHDNTYPSHDEKYEPYLLPYTTPHDKKNDPHDKKDNPHDKKNNPHGNTYPSHDEKYEPYLLPYTTPNDKKNDPHDKKDNPHFLSYTTPHDKKNDPHDKKNDPHDKTHTAYKKTYDTPHTHLLTRKYDTYDPLPHASHYNRPYIYKKKPKCQVYYSSWYEWGYCSRTCGSGFQSRYRYCAHQKSSYCTPPEHDSCKKLGPSHETRECYKKSCCPDKNGKWSWWGCWSYCVNGTRQRQRACDYPRPQGFGLPCNGSSVDTECCTGALDLIFSVDRSASIADDEYFATISAIDNIINQFSLDDGIGHGYDEVRVGVQTFNDEQQVLKQLNDFTTDIGDLTLIAPSGGTDIAASLDQISSVMFTEDNGDRLKPHNENVVVLLTDGHTSGTPMQPANVDRLIVVGIGSSPEDNLSDLASIPDDYMQVNNTCGIISFLQERLLCNDTAVSMNSSLCFDFEERNATATNFTTNFMTF